MGQPLSQDKIAAILAGSRSRGPKKDPTEPRDTNTWFNLKNHKIVSRDSDSSCRNPDCLDPRDPKAERDMQIVAEIKGKNMCRYCFLAGWLSDSPTAVI